MRRIYIFDTTLRDGEQSPGVNLLPDEKLEIARQLERLDVDVIEAGFPATSEGDFEAVSRIAREVRGPVIAALARTHPGDIEAAARALEKAARPRIHTFTSFSRIHIERMLRKTEEEVLEMSVAAVRQARRYVDDVEFSGQDAGRADPDYMVRVIEAVIEAGATVVNIPDTVGWTLPEEFGELIATIRRRVRGIERVTLSVHCHNDLGLATANTLAGLAAGADQAEVAVNGIGERAGNTSLEEVVMAIAARGERLGMYTGVDTREIMATSRLVSRLTGMPVQPNKAIVGANAFAHESGIHQDGVLKERRTYEILDPEAVGLDASNLVLGKHSGRHAFASRLESLGFRLERDQLEEAFRRFKALTDRSKEVRDGDLVALVQASLRDFSRAAAGGGGGAA
ncbi:MAG: 2-isopropylmalate synthase [Clostridia bacterium]|nr:2-isopropylmalate synthase [Clostridia bacterium]